MPKFSRCEFFSKINNLFHHRALGPDGAGNLAALAWVVACDKKATEKLFFAHVATPQVKKGNWKCRLIKAPIKRIGYLKRWISEKEKSLHVKAFQYICRNECV